MDFEILPPRSCLTILIPPPLSKELAPQLLKYPIKLLGKKKVRRIFDKVVATGIGPEVIAKEA